MNDSAERITSKDVDVLKQALDFVKGRAAAEAERGKSAETRAAVTLGSLGVLAGLATHFAEPIRDLPDAARWMTLAVFATGLGFLVKSLVYALRVMRIRSGRRVQILTALDIQSLDKAAALREEIAAVIWEVEQAIAPNTEKLFFLHRSHRNAIAAVVALVILTVMMVVAKESWATPPSASVNFVAAAGLWLLVFLDEILEQFGSWRAR